MKTPEDSPSAGQERERLLREVHRRQKRHARHLREGEESFWRSVGTMGMVGWSVALPTALGALFGRWLDGRLNASGHVFMVFFMLVGLAVGCFTAWRSISEKS